VRYVPIPHEDEGVGGQHEGSEGTAGSSIQTRPRWVNVMRNCYTALVKGVYRIR
jgi:hypothetical protein